MFKKEEWIIKESLSKIVKKEIKSKKKSLNHIYACNFCTKKKIKPWIVNIIYEKSQKNICWKYNINR